MEVRRSCCRGRPWSKACPSPDIRKNLLADHGDHAMLLKPARGSLKTAGPLALSLLMAACSSVPGKVEQPTSVTLAAVQKLAPHKCSASTAAVLDELGVPADQIQSITYDRRTTGTRSNLQGYDAWVRVSDQPGDMVLRQNRSCELFASHNAASHKVLTAGQ